MYILCKQKHTNKFVFVFITSMGSSPGDVGEVPVMKVKQLKGCRMNCDISEATEGLENEL